jgi:hypothetical protein
VPVFEIDSSSLAIDSAQTGKYESAVVDTTGKRPWTKEVWREATRNLTYTPEEKEEKEKPKEMNEETPSPRFNLSDWFQHGFGKALIIILVLGGLLFILFKLLRFSGLKKDAALKPSPEYSLEMIEHDLENSDIDPILFQAISEKKYNLAVRLMYLALLQELNEKNLIQWKKNKTNQHYIYEMTNHAGYARFAELTEVYELVWYGDVPIDVATFDRVKLTFDQQKGSWRAHEE